MTHKHPKWSHCPPERTREGSRDRWSDPRGEFLAAVAAAPVYELLGKRGLGTNEMPSLNQPILHTLGFECHDCKFQITPWDWGQFLSFADMHLKIRKDPSK